MSVFSEEVKNREDDIFIWYIIHWYTLHTNSIEAILPVIEYINSVKHYCFTISLHMYPPLSTYRLVTQSDDVRDRAGSTVLHDNP